MLYDKSLLSFISSLFSGFVCQNQLDRSEKTPELLSNHSDSQTFIIRSVDEPQPKSQNKKLEMIENLRKGVAREHAEIRKLLDIYSTFLFAEMSSLARLRS